MTASGHGDLPDKQGNASAVDATGSSLKTATGHVESDPGESESEPDATGIGPKTTTGHAVTARWRTATETRPAADALDA